MKSIVFILIFSLIFISACEFMIDEEIMAAVKKGDISMCDELDTSKNANRINDCYAQVAAKTGEEDICPKINDGYYQAQCYEKVAIKNKNIELCSKVTAEYNQRNCYTQIAISKKDSSICKQIKETFFQDDCYIEYAKGTGEVNDCYALMTESTKQDECFLWFAEEKKSEKICEKIGSVSIKDDCYQKVGIAIQGNLLCAKIESQTKRDNCYFEVASKMGSVDVCNKIDSKTQLWITCIKQVAITQNNKYFCEMLSDKPAEQESCKLQVDNARAS
nr:hypothetical protein [Nanoarchaeum sp.]